MRGGEEDGLRSAISLGLRTQKKRASVGCTFKASDVPSAQKELHALDDALSDRNQQQDLKLAQAMEDYITEEAEETCTDKANTDYTTMVQKRQIRRIVRNGHSGKLSQCNPLFRTFHPVTTMTQFLADYEGGEVGRLITQHRDTADQNSRLRYLYLLRSCQFNWNVDSQPARSGEIVADAKGVSWSID